MKVKTAGLPRWAWVMLFSGAVLTGLYLRSRSQETEEPEEGEEEPGYNEDSLAAYNGTESAGGLAAAGLIGPAQGQVVPVEAPYIPEGFVDVFGAQSENLGELIGALANREPGERVETIREVEPIGEGSNQGVTGGGPPKRKPSKKAPPSKQKQAQKKSKTPFKRAPNVPNPGKPKKGSGGGSKAKPKPKPPKPQPKPKPPQNKGGGGGGKKKGKK